MSNPTVVTYSQDDFFPIFDLALNVSFRLGTNGIDYQFFAYLTTLLEWSEKNAVSNYRQEELLRQFITLPLFVYTNEFMNAPQSKRLPTPIQNQNRTAALATVGYQARIRNLSAVLMIS
jgi:hypothetical protein